MLVEINSQNPEPRKIRRAIDALEAGDVIAYPTDTTYAIGCDLFNKRAIDRLYQIKGIPKTQLLAFVCGDIADVSRYAQVTDPVYRVMRQLLPGPYCFLLDATREVPKIVQTNRKTVGVRIPNHPVARALVRELGRPIISSTAARHDEDPDPDPREIDVTFKGLAMVLDGGPGGTVPTSIIDLTKDPPEIVREGAGDVRPFLVSA